MLQYNFHMNISWFTIEDEIRWAKQKTDFDKYRVKQSRGC